MNANPAVLVNAATRIRRLGRQARDLVDRRAHPLRRLLVRRQLAAVRVKSALLVCHGNVCRSPFAASLLALLLAREGADVVVSSAGFTGPGRGPPESALAAATKHGVDLSKHRSTLVSHRSLSSADLVVVMSPDQATALRERFGRTRGRIVVLADLDPLPSMSRTIVDPWGEDAATFTASYDRIARCIVELAKTQQTP